MTAPRFHVERLWPGETIVCLGSGPSLTSADADLCRGRARVIAVNDAYKRALWADVLYAADNKWWGWASRNYKGQHPEFARFAGLKIGIKPYTGVSCLKQGAATGLSSDPGVLCTGFNSGYQAINLAVHLGAARILLLGYDMRGDHFFGAHPDGTRPPFTACKQAFATLVEPLRALGIPILNCTPGSALTCFPMQPLRDALAVPMAEAV